MFEEMFLGQYLSGTGHEIVEEGELLGGQRERHALPGDLKPCRVHYERSDFESRVRRNVAPEKSPDPSRQLGESKRLHEVVVGSRIQPRHAIADIVSSGQHQDSRSLLFEEREIPADQGATEFEAGPIREIPVEANQVVARRAQFEVCVICIQGDIDRMAIAPQPSGKSLSEVGLIFHNKQSHP
jgi:hypothetical protein